MESSERHPESSEPRSHASAARYASLGDYLRVIRRRRVLILLIAVLFAAVAAAYSVTRDPTYVATTQISFRDVLADLNLLGTGGGLPEQGPAQRAGQNAELLTGPKVARIVRRDLDDPPGTISTQVSTQTSLVLLQARAGTAQDASRLANGYARAAERVVKRSTRRRLTGFEDATIDQIREVKENPIAGVTGIRLSVLEQQLSRLKTVQQIAEPVQIVAKATPPGSPASPNPVRDTTLGLVLGLVIGLLAAFLRDSLDRRLHTAHEVHRELGLPVLGRIADTAFGYSGLATNGLPPMTGLDFEAFRVLRMNLAYLNREHPVRSLLVTSSLPEEGKTTVSMALASAAVMAGQRTLLVECDLRRPVFARRFGIEAAPGLTDYLMGRVGPRDILHAVQLSPPQAINGSEQDTISPGTLVCITAGSLVGNNAELLLTDRFQAFLDKVERAYDLVVIDSSPMLAVVDPLELVPKVDGVIVCVRAEQTTRDELHAARAALATLPDRPMGAVLTGVSRGGPDSYEYYYGY